jgi:hypothetical protein
MAKVKQEKYSPSESELEAMRICVRNDLAYIIKPIQFSKMYHVIKFQITDNLKIYTYELENKKIEFTEYEASKKVMELYTQHSKRFSK